MDSKPKSGMESMLRSLGLSEVLDAANALAKSGAVQRVVVFADQVEGMNARQERIERKLDALLTAAGVRWAEVEPDPGYPDSGFVACEPISIGQPDNAGVHFGAGGNGASDTDVGDGTARVTIEGERVSR